MIRKLFLVIVLVAAAGCNRTGGGASGGSIRILAASENKTLQPILDRYAKEHNVDLKLDYLGSVDIMMRLQAGAKGYDAVWPANSIWIALGDKQKRVKDDKSLFWSPVVLGVRKSVAQRLGWIGKDVKVEDILNAAEGGKLRFMMTSASQSNSGASAYLGFLYAFAGKPDVLTAADLEKPSVAAKIKRILGSVNRTAGSSGWLKDLFLQKYDAYDAMFNYESVIIEANQQLASEGREPLYVVYPSDGQAIADYPFGYLDNKDEAKSKLFHELQDHLLSPSVQQEIVGMGRRTGPVGEKLANASPSVFNADWGINTTRFLSPIKYPRTDVLRRSLELYQTAFRKPSFTVYCLDYSGSMREGGREEGLKTAMRLILDQEQAAQSMLQASPNDVTVVIPFSSRPMEQWMVRGNKPDAMRGLLARIENLAPEGGTDIYSPVIQAVKLMHEYHGLENYAPAVILLTDGQSNEGASIGDFQVLIGNSRNDIPVYSIRFGDADPSQLKGLAEATSGRMFDGKADLVAAFREVKGYN